MIGTYVQPFGDDVFEGLSPEHQKLTLTIMANSIRHYENNYNVMGKCGHRTRWLLWYCHLNFGEINDVNMSKAKASFNETSSFSDIILMNGEEWKKLDNDIKYQNLKNIKLIINSFELATGQILNYWRCVWIYRCCKFTNISNFNWVIEWDKY